MKFINKILSLFRRKPVAPDITLLEISGLHYGMYCYELNIDTREIRVVPTYRTNLGVMVEPSPNCIYEPAININNAIRKFLPRVRKIIEESKKQII